MTTQKAQVEYGLTTIDFSISRSHGRSTIGVTVNPDGTVTVAAPKGTRRTKISEAVKTKAEWVLEQQEYFRRLQNGYPKQFVSGESLHYLGRQYKLKVVRSRAKGVDAKVRMVRGLLQVTLPKELTSKERSDAVRQCLVDWYRDRAAEHIPGIAAKFAKSLGVNYTSLQIRDMKKRWGSATNGRLAFNWRIIMAPRRLLDYVVAHELCHFVYHDHSSEFWRQLERTMPDYERRRVALAVQGPKYDF